jgi:hypothetical protein
MVMTDNGTLDDRYLTWLDRQLEPETQKNPARSHFLLIEQLFKTEFAWFVPNDDNRLYDGLDVRQEFIDLEEGGDVPGIWLGEPCSFLEMVVALSRRMSFESGLDTDYWFWRLMDNLNLRQYVDEIYDEDVVLIVEETLNIVLNRTYHADGNGGLFPMIHPGKDQRQVELWYQMSQYLMENINV